MEEKDINEQTTQLTDEASEQPILPEEEATNEVVEDDDPIESENVDDVAPVVPEEALEEAQPAVEAAPKKKRKLSKKKIVLICIAAFLALVMIGVGIFFLVGTIRQKDVTVVKGEFHNKPPVAAVTYTDAELTLIENAMKKNASESTVKQAIAMIYNKANANKIAASQAITILQGQGGAKAFGAVGSMAVRGFKVQAGTSFYYQKAAPIVECDIKALQPSLEDLLNQQERSYTNGVDAFYATGTLKGDAAGILLDDVKNPMTKTIPFIPVEVPKKMYVKNKKTYETFMQDGYYLADPREITNFNINENTIVLKPLADDEKRIEKVVTEDGDYYYICRFSLLIEGENRGECVDKARQYLRDSAKSDDLEYKKFDIRLEVWENGFFKMMHDEEEWIGKAKGVTTTSTSWYESITYYDFDAEIFTEEDAAAYEGENWAQKIIDHYKEELGK